MTARSKFYTFLLAVALAAATALTIGCGSADKSITAVGSSHFSTFFSAKDGAGTDLFTVRRDGRNEMQISVFDNLTFDSAGTISGKLQGYKSHWPPVICSAETANTTWLDTNVVPNRLRVCVEGHNGTEWATIPLIIAPPPPPPPMPILFLKIQRNGASDNSPNARFLQI